MTTLLESRLTCPICAHSEMLIMPTEACQWFHECPACKTLLKPKPGDCCVFCSYGSAPCPPVQQAQARSPESAIGFLIRTRLPRSIHTQE